MVIEHHSLLGVERLNISQDFEAEFCHEFEAKVGSRV